MTEGLCPECGERLAPEEAFCANCGTRIHDRDRAALASRRVRLSDSSLVNGQCRSCNGPLRSTDAFCPECGARRDPTSGGPSVHRSGNFERLRGRLEEVAGNEFEILDELGRGGMGAVYLARERTLDRPVAIKVLFPKFLADESMLERFRNEARIVAALRHPSIVGLHAVRNLEDLHFFVMDYIEGASLEKLIRTHGPLPVAAVKAVLYQVGSALAYAHRQGKGVIHRDVKPSNIMLDSEGSAVVMDFGISKAINRSQGLTMTGAIIGTPEYMSPEQCRGDALTPASDQYSLGLVAHTMLTGAPPFSGPHYAVLLAHLTDAPPSIRELRPDCPEEVEAAVGRMLSKSPADRFEDIRSGLRALGARALEHGDPVRETVAGLVREAGGGRRRATVVAEVSISRPPRIVVPGDRFMLEAVPMDELGKELDDREVVWASTDPGVISRTPDGAFEARAEGRAWLKALCEGREAAVEVVVTRAPVVTVRLSAGPAEVRPGDRFVLEATPLDGGGAPLTGRETTWSSSNAGVAFVTASGAVEAVGPGASTITAECEGASAALELEVLEPAVARVWVSAAPAVLRPGDEFSLDVAVLDRKGVRLEGRPVAWEVQPQGALEPLGDGRFVARRSGEAEILVRCDGVSATTPVTVLSPPTVATRSPETPAPSRPAPPGGPGRVGGETIAEPRLPAPARGVEPEGPPSPKPATPVVGPAPKRTDAKPAPATVARGRRGPGLWLALAGVGAVAVAAVVLFRGGDQGSPGGTADTFDATRAEAGSTTELPSTGAEGSVDAARAVAALELATATAELRVGDTLSVRATARDAEGRAVAGADLSWSVSRSTPGGSIVVSDRGVVTALGPGSGEIAVRSGAAVARLSVTVTGATAPSGGARVTAEESGRAGPGGGARRLARLAVQGAGGELRPGEERVYRVAGLGAEGAGFAVSPGEVRWRATATAVAQSLGGGRIRAVAPGVSWVVATVGGVSDSIRVVVAGAIPSVASVVIEGAPSRLSPGQTATLGARVRDGSGEEVAPAVAWRSTAPEVLTIEGDGRATGRSAGRAVVVASFEGVADSVSIEVVAPVSVALTTAGASEVAAAFAELLRSGAAGRIAALAGGEDDVHRDLLTLVRESSRGLEVGAPTEVEIRSQDAGSATVRFTLPLQWRGSFGNSQRAAAAFEGTVSLRDGTWSLTGCRLLRALSL